MKFYCYLLLFIAATHFSFTQEAITSVEGKVIEVKHLTAEVKFLMDSLDMPGLSMAILNDREVVYHDVYGVSNLRSMDPLDKESIFEGASLSKPIFAFFALKMVDMGLLDLDKPLHEYLPHPAIDSASVESYKKITSRMILSHSTGFPNFSNGQIIKLPFEPGTDFLYSGEAYQYLAAVIGRLNGVGWKEKFNDIFEAEVTKPLGMTNTSFLWNDHLASHKVYGHKGGEPTDNGLGGWSGKTFNAFSSIHSEAYEYALFIKAILKKEGLKEATFSQMLAPENRLHEDNELRIETGQTAWGLGFAQKPTKNGLMHLHTGNNHDFQSYCMFIVERGYGIVLFTNSDKLLPFVQGLEKLLGTQF